jgi:hypothetical protein
VSNPGLKNVAWDTPVRPPCMVCGLNSVRALHQARMKLLDEQAAETGVPMRTEPHEPLKRKQRELLTPPLPEGSGSGGAELSDAT